MGVKGDLSVDVGWWFACSVVDRTAKIFVVIITFVLPAAQLAWCWLFIEPADPQILVYLNDRHHSKSNY